VQRQLNRKRVDVLANGAGIIRHPHTKNMNFGLRLTAYTKFNKMSYRLTCKK
jgi:hypothetical protein